MGKKKTLFYRDALGFLGTTFKYKPFTGPPPANPAGPPVRAAIRSAVAFAPSGVISLGPNVPWKFSMSWPYSFQLKFLLIL